MNEIEIKIAFENNLASCEITQSGNIAKFEELSDNLYTSNIIKTHPDYQELQLPIEPKFKVGDWIVRGKGFVYEPSLITEIRDYYICELQNGERVTYTLNDVHKNFHLWTIADAKDGDVLIDETTNTIGIFEEIYGICWHSKIYCSNSTYNTTVYHRGGSHEIKFTKPATKEQRNLLFAKMREAGYEWDADKNELRKVKQHYDIANFKPFDKVLVRYADADTWRCTFFSHCVRGPYAFFCTDCTAYQCIPFNDDTKHLLGTCDPCPEEYINW